MKKIFVAVLLVFATTIAYAGIATTKHNLTSTSPFPTHTDDPNTTLCEFCHIPHGANSTIQEAPLWSRATPGGPYMVYGQGQTLSGTTVNQPGSVSLACLSCHDGTIAINNIVKNGVQISKGNMTGSVDNANRLIDANVADPYNPVVGPDLTNDHPIGMQYRGTQATLAGLVDANNRTVAGKFPLYGPTKDQMECATCHDPHTSQQQSFLRSSKSTLCQECHVNK